MIRHKIQNDFTTFYKSKRVRNENTVLNPNLLAKDIKLSEIVLI